MSNVRADCILSLRCPDRVGIVAAVSGFLAARQCNITESSQFGDRESGRFFMRTCFNVRGRQGLADLSHEFGPVADALAMDWALHDARRKTRTLIMVSKYSHCLVGLLHRYRTGRLNIDIPAIVSNHPDLEPMAEFYGIPFLHWPCTQETKAEQEKKVLQLMGDERVDLVVLARYMQILSDDFCERTVGRVINIHHSFLPSFKGARPYHQAHARGVKVIGATAHYVTSDLDEGPIIDQEIFRVSHKQSAGELVRLGEDVEVFTLSRAVQAHVEHRVMLNGSRTVVFR